ncbi:MAG TPA: hypothetical protein VFZ08_14255 [Terriglobia bacterium]|nr:hypothetical protein [Terriglobia bacterium]
MTPKFLLLSGFIFMVSVAAFAQNTPRMEIGGEYSFAVANLSSTNSPFFPAPVALGQSFDMRGWGVSVTENVDDWFGLTQDVSGLYANPRLNGFNHKTRIYSFLSGPRFSYRHIERVTPYAHALFGYGQMSMKVPAAGGISATSESYAMALGGGLDVHLHGIFTLRLVQADYYLTRFFGSTQNNLRLSAGLMIQFGRTRY